MEAEVAAVKEHQVGQTASFDVADADTFDVEKRFVLHGSSLNLELQITDRV